MALKAQITRGYRTHGFEDNYMSDPSVEIVAGNIITSDGQLATLTDTHIECGVAYGTNKGPMETDEPSGMNSVYISNFAMTTKEYTGLLVKGDAVSVADGKMIKVNSTNTIVWGYITKADPDGTVTVRCNY